MKKNLLIVFILTAVSSAGAISRSGGGKLESVALGFIADAPAAYARANPLINDGVRLWSDSVFGSAPLSNETFIEVRTFQSEFPDYAQQDRSVLEQSFTKLSWVKDPPSSSCIDIYRRDSSSVSAVVAVWGPGRGIVILGGLSEIARASIQTIASTVGLSPGSCGW